MIRTLAKIGVWLLVATLLALCIGYFVVKYGPVRCANVYSGHEIVAQTCTAPVR